MAEEQSGDQSPPQDAITSFSGRYDVNAERLFAEAGVQYFGDENESFDERVEQLSKLSGLSKDSAAKLIRERTAMIKGQGKGGKCSNPWD